MSPGRGETFEAEAYDFWFLRATGRLRRRRLRWPLDAIAVGLLVWVVALAAVLLFGQAGLYVRTPAFYAGAFGVALVLAVACRGVERLVAGLEGLEPVAEDRSAYRRLVERDLAGAASLRSTLPWVAAGLLAAAALVTGALTRWSGESPAEERFSWFPAAWHAELVPAGLALGAFGLAVAVTFATAVELLLRNLRFVWRLRHLPFIAFPARVRARLQPVVRTYAFVSIGWSLGVPLFAAFFVGQYTPARVAGVAAIFLLGLLTFAVPFLAFRTVLDRSHDGMCEALAARLPQDGHQPDFDRVSAEEFVAVNTAMANDPPPVLTRRGAITYVGFQAAAIAGLVAKDVLQDAVKSGARQRL